MSDAPADSDDRTPLNGVPDATAMLRTTPHLAGPGLRESLRTPGFMPKIQSVTQWWNRTRLSRMLTRYGRVNGGLLASGLALTALLSLTAAATLGFTVFMAVLGGNTELRQAVVEAVNEVLPGLVKSGEVDGLIPIDSLQASTGSTVTSVVALAVMLWTASGVVGSLATSIRAMFGVVAVPQNAVIGVLRSFAGVAALGLAVVASAVLGIGLNLFSEWIYGHFSIPAGAGRTAISLASMVVTMLVDTGLVAFLVAFVARVRVPRQDLLVGSVLGGIASLVLREVGTAAVGAVKGPLLTTATTLVTLVLWIYLLVRVVLYVCAWMANPPAPQPVTDPAQVHFHERPNYVTMSHPETLEWSHHPITGAVLPAAVPAGLPDEVRVDDRVIGH